MSPPVAVAQSAFGVPEPIGKLWTPEKHKRARDGKFATLEGLEAKKIKAFSSHIQPVGPMPRGQRVRDLSAADQAERKRRRLLYDQRKQQEFLFHLATFGGTITLVALLPKGRRLFNARQLTTGAAGAMRAPTFVARTGATLGVSTQATRQAAMASPGAARALAHDFAAMRTPEAKSLSQWVAGHGVTQSTINSARSSSPNDQAKLVMQLLEHADPADTPDLVRGMHGVRPNKVGDVVDFGEMASFTSDFTVGHEWIKNSLARSGQIHALFLLEKGSAPALRIDQSMRMNPMHEWLVGGRYEIVHESALPSFGTTSRAPVKMYTIRPHTPAPPAPAPVTKNLENRMSTSAFGVQHEISKDDYKPGTSRLGRREFVDTTSTRPYPRGTITYHHEQAALHSRKKRSAARQAEAGAAVATAAAAAHHELPRYAPRIARAVTPVATGPGLGPVQDQLKVAYRAGKIVRHGRQGALAAVVGGAGLAATGVGRRIYHGHQQNVSAHAAQDARLNRRHATAQPGQLRKSAFGIVAPPRASTASPPSSTATPKRTLTGQHSPAMTAPAAPGGLSKVKAKLAPLSAPATGV